MQVQLSRSFAERMKAIASGYEDPDEYASCLLVVSARAGPISFAARVSVRCESVSKSVSSAPAFVVMCLLGFRWEKGESRDASASGYVESSSQTP
jgi:hypothetical protein